MNLIDVDELKEKEQYIPCGNGLLFHGVTAATIDAMPVVDARPVVLGRWEFVKGSNGKEYMVCSECRVQQDLTGVFTYCPNCGALMVWEEEATNDKPYKEEVSNNGRNSAD